MKTVAWIIGLPIGALLLLAAIGGSMSPEKSRAYGLQAQVDSQCTQMMSDAALGNERRNTRELCEALKAEAQRRIAAAK